MEISGEPEPVRSRLRELSDVDFLGAAKRFVNLLRNKDPQYVFSSFNNENLYRLALIYFGEYGPLKEDFQRRQAAGIKGVDKSAFADVYQELRGKMPEELAEELRNLSRRQIGSENWNPAVDGKRIKFLQGIADFYRQQGELPFPWFIFLWENKENIRRVMGEIGKKQVTEELTGKERVIANFLNQINKNNVLF